MKWLILIFVFISSALYAQDSIVEREDEPPVHLVDKSDPQMNNAIIKARASVGELISNLDKLKKEGNYFSVKVFIKEGDTSEHMWLSDVSYEDGKFSGNIANSPLYLQNIKYGDPVTVSANEISDWLFILDENLHGGYTIRLSRERMTPAQQQAFDQRFPYIKKEQQ